MANVDKYKFWCQKVLPLVYDDSLSYYESVCQLVKKINELVDTINSFSDDVLEQTKQYVNQRYGEILQEFNQLKSDVNSEIESQNGRITQFSNDINNRLVIMNARLDEFDREIQSYLKASRDYTDQAILNNNEYIISETTKAFGSVRVVNYFTGARVTIQEMFDYLAQFHLTNAITYGALRDRRKTYNQLIAYNMSYTDLAINGGNIIV